MECIAVETLKTVLKRSSLLSPEPVEAQPRELASAELNPSIEYDEDEIQS